MKFDTDMLRAGFTLHATIEPDTEYGTPWDNEDGHGPVSDWTTRDKLPGELILSNDRSSKRFYDFAEACRMARRDGWGFLPAPFRLTDASDGRRMAVCEEPKRHGRTIHVGYGDDDNAAITDLYAVHRARYPSARAYAAAAARADYERLRAWCDDRWSYIGVVVTVSRNGITLATESLCGIASDADEYLASVANKLADTAIESARAAIAALTE